MFPAAAAPATDIVMKPVFAALVALSFTAPMMMVAPAQAAVTIQEVTSDSGVTAWLVEDYTVPIIAVNFAFEGGSTQDPVGKEGLAQLMSGLFDEGAGDMPRAAFQEALDLSGAEMSFNVSPDAFYGSLRTLADDRAEAFRLLQLAVNQPRFDAEPLARIRAQMVAGIEARANDPDQAASIAWANAIYGDHPYSRRSEGTPETLATITRDDLEALHRALFARGNLVVGVVGAIDAETLKAELDRTFGALPESPDMRPIERVEPKLDQFIGVSFPVPQASLRLAFPGVERDDPRFFAAYMMNHVLGGGTFSSRLFDEVRDRRGLAYGVGSSLANRDHSSALIIGTSTRADRAGEALQVIRDVIARMAAEGPTEQELADAKAYIVGSYAINNLDSSAAIARTLVQLQMDDLGIDYIERRGDLIGAVTLDEVKAAARDLLSVEPAIMILGPDAAANVR
ncbi:insulinase family protein [Aquibium carbonis]|uniref:Insulinase family protein n=1 Tax=Aquibium carbonis TaxID=2495581 RepID=A0A3S0ATY4_9HYPH|nr:pitrilysin family protein [Aquibium carbonis]RST87031.1 insulinase family protein [Aquibium carbonis]